MKRKLLFLASLISTSMVLTACGGTGEGGGITLPNTAEEAINMFYQFATTNGIEITYRVYDDESQQPELNTIGFKNDVFWVKEDVAYKKDGTTLEMYEYDASKQSYEFQAAVTETAQMSLDAMLKNFTAVFYAGYEYASHGDLGSFSSKKDVTFLSRPATEYTFSYVALDAQASLKIVFDNATGITLKIYGSASSGEGASSAEYEVTSFAIGDAVRVPTLNKSSGQGGNGGSGEGGNGGSGEGGEGGGGQQDVDYFSNKLLVYVSHQNANLYVNSQLALFEDDKFELSFYESNFLVVKLGEYSVGADKTVATLSVKKVYKDRDQQYFAMNETLALTYASGGYTLQVSTNGKVNYMASGQSPVHADIPEEGGSQTGDDAKYKITETQWNNMIVNRGLISLTSNFTMVTGNSGNQEKYEFDNGKVHYTSAVNELFYEFTSLTSGYVYYKSNGQWKKGDADGMHQLFDDYIGILPVPYSKVSFNSDAHYYGCSQWTTIGADGQQDSYQNAYFYFEDSNLMKTSFKHWNVDHLYNFSKHSQTSVTLPQVSGGQTDQNARYKITSAIWEDMILDAGLVGLTSNFTAMVRASDLPQGQQNKYEFDNGKIHYLAADGHEQYEEFTSESSGYTYTKNDSGVWTKSNNTFGIASYMNSLGMLPLEFSQLTFNESTHEYELATFNDPYGGGVYASNIAISFVDNKLMKMSYTREGVYRETEFAKYGQTTVTLPEVGGGQQQTSKWPAEDIAAKLQTLGLNVTVPAPSVSEENIDSVSANIPADNSGLSIVITLNGTNNIGSLLYGYMSGFTGFEPDYNASEFSEDGYSGTYALFNEAKDIIIKLTYDVNSPVFRIFIAKYSGNPFPSTQIAAFFTALELDVSFPDLSMDNVTYNFNGMPEEEFGMLTMEPLGDNTNASIISNIETILLRNNFKVYYTPSYSDEGGLDSLYIDPTCTYYVSFYEYEGKLYLNIVIGGEEMAAAVDFRYPEQKINAFKPEKVEDVLPSLAVDGAIYMVGPDGDGFQLQIHLQPGMSAESIISGLQTRIGRSGYTLSEEDEGYYSENDQIVIYFNNRFDKIIEIQVRFIEPEEPPIEEPVDVTYTFVCDSDWNIFEYGATFYVYVWNDEGENDWIPLNLVEGKTFEVEISNKWTYCIVVRLNPEEEPSWDAKWNQSDDLKLNGEGGEIHFTL